MNQNGNETDDLTTGMPLHEKVQLVFAPGGGFGGRAIKLIHWTVVIVFAVGSVAACAGDIVREKRTRRHPR